MQENYNNTDVTGIEVIDMSEEMTHKEYIDIEPFNEVTPLSQHLSIKSSNVVVDIEIPLSDPILEKNEDMTRYYNHIPSREMIWYEMNTDDDRTIPELYWYEMNMAKAETYAKYYITTSEAETYSKYWNR
jgi:hypothetical protein